MKEKKEQVVSKIPSLYTPAGFYMIRAPLLSAHTFLNLTNSFGGEDPQAEDLEVKQAEQRSLCYQVLRQLAVDPIVEQSLHVASSDLFEGIARIQKDEAMNRRVQRAYMTLFRYLVRMSTRPTPFGLFAGIAVGRLGKQTTISLGASSVESIRIRPDMGWLLSVIQKIETDQTLISSLSVVANSMIYPAGARYILPHADVYGQQDNRSIAVRHTPVVQHALEKAYDPLPYKELRRSLATTFSTAKEQQIDTLLQQLWKNHYLISNLRPPLTSANPEIYVLKELEKIPEASTFRDLLASVIKHTEAMNRRGVRNTTAEFQLLKEQQMNFLPGYEGYYCQVDTALCLEKNQLNEEIGQAAADATTALLLMTQFPRGGYRLHEYKRAFLERYGSDAEIPLLELLSPETGLDAPPGYLEPARISPLPPEPQPSTQQRDGPLSMLLLEAIRTQAQEVEITDEILEQLTQWTPQSGGLPPTILEMYLQIQASSVEAIDRGEWKGVIAPMGLSYGGRTFCRFFDILKTEALNDLGKYMKHEEELFPDKIFAELSFLPISAKNANVVVRPPLRSYEIVVNTTPSVPPERVIALHDLVVGMRDERFYVRSVRLGKEVVVTQSHLLNPVRAPNVCRFLLDISHDGQAGPMPFEWGTMNQAPCLPRVVRKNIVLSPAQWNVRRSTIKPTTTGSEELRFFSGVQRWRARWNVPRYVYLTNFDERLLLDLEHPLSVQELRRELDTRDSLVLQEMLPDFEHLWLKDRVGAPYVCEIVLPLILNNQHKEGKQKETEVQLPSMRLMTSRSQQHLPVGSKERRKFPGDDWTFLKLYAVPNYHNEIITKALREGVRRMEEKQLIDRWFFIRYFDPEPHLRIRFRAAHPSQRDAVLATAAAWSKEIAEYGLVSKVVIDSYDREVERYGGPEALDTMEQVFTVNSAALSEIVAAMYQQRITLDPTAIAVFTLDQFFEMWGFSFSERLQYAQGLSNSYDARQAFYSQRKLLCELLFPRDTASFQELGKPRELLCRLSSLQAPVLSQASSHTRALAAQNELWNTERTILSSLAHMHLNRLMGPASSQEMRTYAFWRYTLESLQKRLSAQKGKFRQENKVLD